MSSQGDETRRLRRTVVVLAVVLALIVGAGIGVVATLMARPGQNAQAVETPTPTATSTPTPTPTPTPSATKKPAAVGPAVAQCPSGGLKIGLNGAVARNNNGVIKVLAGYLLTNTSNRFAIKVSTQSFVTLASTNNAGVLKSTIRGINQSTVTVNSGAMKIMSLTHDGYSLQAWQASTKLRVNDRFTHIQATWVGSGCKVPITVGTIVKPLPALR